MYSLQYKGYIEILQSTVNLGRSKRAEMAKEAVTRICIGKLNKKFNGLVDTSPRYDNRGPVIFNVSKNGFEIKTLDDKEVIAFHQRELISYVTTTTFQSHYYVVYCARDRMNFRACYILECSSQQLQEINSNINLIFQENHSTMSLHQSNSYFGIRKAKSVAQINSK